MVATEINAPATGLVQKLSAVPGPGFPNSAAPAEQTAKVMASEAAFRVFVQIMAFTFDVAILRIWMSDSSYATRFKGRRFYRAVGT